MATVYKARTSLSQAVGASGPPAKRPSRPDPMGRGLATLAARLRAALPSAGARRSVRSVRAYAPTLRPERSRGSLPCSVPRCYADGGVGVACFGVRFARALAAFAYASGLRFLKYASVSLACFADSTHVLPFALAGRAYVLRRYARTTFPEIPSVAAKSSGRNVFAFAIVVTSLRSVVESAYADTFARTGVLVDSGALLIGTEYTTRVRFRTSQRSRLCYATLRSVARVRDDTHRLVRIVTFITTPPTAPPRLPTRNSHAEPWRRRWLTARRAASTEVLSTALSAPLLPFSLTGGRTASAGAP